MATKQRITLQRLINWYQRPETRPPDLAFITYDKHVSKPVLRWDDYYYEQRMRTWERSRRLLPKHPEACPLRQEFRFGFTGSPDVYVFLLEPGRRARLFREQEVLVPQTQLVPV